MIKFFRKIRQNLLNEGKTTRYFKYAIGEIVLVVIGILIALQINNWNEERKNNKQELKNFEGLYTEIIQNLEFTINHKISTEKRLIAIQDLLNISINALESITDEQLNQKLYDSAIIRSYSPLVSMLNRLLSNENLESKQANKLITTLYVYNRSIRDINEVSNAETNTFRGEQVPLFIKNISVKNIMHQKEPKEISKSKNVLDIKPFIKSLEFENTYADLYASTKRKIFLLDENIEIIQRLIKLIEKTYPSIAKDKKQP